MYKHILVPLDGSSLAERVLAPAETIAKGLGAQLTLLRVVPQFTLVAADPMLYEEMSRLGEEEAHAYLRSIGETIDPAIRVKTVTEHGSAADGIVAFAIDHQVDLIMMSSHGRSGLNRWVFGSVAERVLRGAPCATAVINTRAEPKLPSAMKILVPLDGSDLAERALLPARQLAEALGAELRLLRIITSDHPLLETGAMRSVFDSMQEQETTEAESYLQTRYADLDGDTVFYDVVATEGTVADAIIDYAAAHSIDLIAMSSHGRTGLRRWVYGSVAEKVLRSACCATLIVREAAV